MDKLTEALGEFLKRAIVEGFQFPFIMASVAANGTVLVNRCTSGPVGLDTELIAEHIEDETMILPINVMLTDSTGQAARMVIEAHDIEPEFIWPRSLPDSSTGH